MELYGNQQTICTQFSFSIGKQGIFPVCLTHDLSAGTSTPPGISATAVPSIATPIGVNGFSALPPQSNGQPTSEPIYTNGIHPYPGETFTRGYLRSIRDLVTVAFTLKI